MPQKLLEIAAEIVQTQASNSQLSSEEIVSSLKQIFGALQEVEKLEAQGTVIEPIKETVVVPEKTDPKDSIQADKIVCLECGAEMRQLTVRHLQGHGLNLREYRRKYGFSLKQPLSAKSLTKLRSKQAKKRGLPENLKKYLAEKKQGKADAALAPEPVVVAEIAEETKAPAKRSRAKK